MAITEVVGVGGIRGATFIIAANDSKDKSKADYICDGTNDENEINQGISNLPSAGGRVILLEGTYNIGSTININKSNVTLEGQGRGTKLFLVNNSNCHVIQVGNGSASLDGIKIANLQIDGNRENQSDFVSGVHFSGGEGALITNCVIENCKVVNCYDHGILLYCANNNRISGNQLESNQTAGLCLHTSNNNIVTENQCNSNTNGIEMHASDNNMIIGNKCTGNDCGIYIEPDCDYNLVAKNYCTGNATEGIHDDGTGTILGADATNDNVV